MTPKDKAEMLRIVSSCAWPMVSDHPFATFADRLADEAARLSAPDEQAAAPSPVPQEGLLSDAELNFLLETYRSGKEFIGKSALTRALEELQHRRTAAAPSGEGFSKNGIRHGERVVCIDAPSVFGTVIRCAEDGVDVRWDDGQLGELIWKDGVCHNAYRLQCVRRDTTIERLSAPPQDDSVKRWLELNPHDCDSPAIYMAEMKERGDAMAASIGRLEEKLVLFDAIRKESIERREKLEAAEARLKAAEEVVLAVTRSDVSSLPTPVLEAFVAWHELTARKEVEQ